MTKGEKNEKRRQEYLRREQALKDLGYIIKPGAWNGKNPMYYIYEYNGEKIENFAWDDHSSVLIYLENKLNYIENFIQNLNIES